nr:hypothetical protein BaRGS_016702 [Batillaria attramentaria]
MRMRAADDRNDGSDDTASPTYHATPSASPPQHHYPLHHGGGSPVLTELLPSRPHPSGALHPREGHQNATLFAVSPTGTPHLPEGYENSDHYSPHQLSYQADSGHQVFHHHHHHHYNAAADDHQGRSVSDSESGYHTPESSPYSQTAHSRCSPPTVAAGITRPESAAAWGSPTSSTAADFAAKDDYVSLEPASLPTTNYLPETPCYLPSTTLLEHFSQKQSEKVQEAERVPSPGNLKDPNEVYGDEDRQQILDNLLTRNPMRMSEAENMSPSSAENTPKRGSGYKKRRRRTQTPVQRTAANMRERRRMCHLNVAFDKLKDHLPNVRNTKKLSRIQTLRAAIYYIGLLTDCLHMA